MSLADDLCAIVGAQQVISGPRAAGYLTEWRGAFKPRALAVVRPADTAQVAAIVRACGAAGAAVVAQSGNTGLVGGAAADDARQQVIVSLERMDAIRAIDTDNHTMTVEAGCILADAQAAAGHAGLYFPLSLASRHRCRIGGNLATNAGGLNVVRYGNTRDLALGLEVVLADGRVWHDLNGLRKDNSGFDLKDLFIGSEGALGIMTAAVFNLYPPIRQRATALVGLADPAVAVTLQRQLRDAGGDNLIACELMARFATELAFKHIDGCRDPLTRPHAWYLLVELGSSATGEWLMTALQDTLAAAHAHVAMEYAVARDTGTARLFWHLRESLPAAQVAEGASIKHDISLPVAQLPAFLARALPAVREVVPDVRPCPFGHVGDGNLHFNLTLPAGGERASFLARGPALNRVVYDIVADMAGSIAAEHGIGRLKPALLQRYKMPEELAMMRAIKSALDPDNRLNPGAVVA